MNIPIESKRIKSMFGRVPWWAMLVSIVTATFFIGQVYGEQKTITENHAEFKTKAEAKMASLQSAIDAGDREVMRRHDEAIKDLTELIVTAQKLENQILVQMARLETELVGLARNIDKMEANQ